MAVVYLVILTGCPLRAVVQITHVVKLELLSLTVPVGIGEVIARVERAIELYAALREVLLLARDAVHVVIPP